MAPIGLRRNGDDSILQCCILYQRLLQGHQVGDMGHQVQACPVKMLTVHRHVQLIYLVSCQKLERAWCRQRSSMSITLTCWSS